MAEVVLLSNLLIPCFGQVGSWTELQQRAEGLPISVERAESWIAAALESPNWSDAVVRVGVLQLAAILGHWDRILPLAGDEDESVRWALVVAISWCWKNASPEDQVLLAERLDEMVDDHDQRIRSGAIEVLCAVDQSVAGEALQRRLHADDEQHSLEVAIAMARAGDERAIHRLWMAVMDEESVTRDGSGVRDQVLEALIVLVADWWSAPAAEVLFLAWAVPHFPVDTKRLCQIFAGSTASIIIDCWEQQGEHESWDDWEYIWRVVLAELGDSLHFHVARSSWSMNVDWNTLCGLTWELLAADYWRPRRGADEVLSQLILSHPTLFSAMAAQGDCGPIYPWTNFVSALAWERIERFLSSLTSICEHLLDDQAEPQLNELMEKLRGSVPPGARVGG